MLRSGVSEWAVKTDQTRTHDVFKPVTVYRAYFETVDDWNIRRLADVVLPGYTIYMYTSNEQKHGYILEYATDNLKADEPKVRRLVKEINATIGQMCAMLTKMAAWTECTCETEEE